MFSSRRTHAALPREYRPDGSSSAGPSATQRGTPEAALAIAPTAAARARSEPPQVRQRLPGDFLQHLLHRRDVTRHPGDAVERADHGEKHGEHVADVLPLELALRLRVDQIAHELGN